jgi:hypothetical protein
MSSRRIKAIIGLAVAVLVCTYCFNVGYLMLWLPAVSPHEGDGRFVNLSRRAGPLAVPGYGIEMPEFDLAQAMRAEYSVSKLPVIGRKCGVHLGLRDANGTFITHDTPAGGWLSIELLDSRFRTIAKADGRLGDYIWAGVGEKIYLHYLYQMDHSFFDVDSGETYRLRFSYEPDPRLAGYKGFAYFRCGGHK